MFAASQLGKLELVKLLLRAGANPNTGLKFGELAGMMPLAAAIAKDYDEIVKRLLRSVLIRTSRYLA